MSTSGRIYLTFLSFHQDREQPPRFAIPNTFEYDFAQRWKQLYDLEKQQREQLEVQIGEARERLQEEEQFAIQEWHAQQLRQGRQFAISSVSYLY